MIIIVKRAGQLVKHPTSSACDLGALQAWSLLPPRSGYSTLVLKKRAVLSVPGGFGAKIPRMECLTCVPIVPSQTTHPTSTRTTEKIPNFQPLFTLSLVNARLQLLPRHRPVLQATHGCWAQAVAGATASPANRYIASPVQHLSPLSFLPHPCARWRGPPSAIAIVGAGAAAP